MWSGNESGEVACGLGTSLGRLHVVWERVWGGCMWSGN